MEKGSEGGRKGGREGGREEEARNLIVLLPRGERPAEADPALADLFEGRGGREGGRERGRVTLP